MEKTNIKELKKYITENKANGYIINNTILMNSTDYIKSNYLKMLAVILHQAKEITVSQMFLFKRIIAGSCSEYNADSFLRMALEINVSDFEKFFIDCGKDDLKYRLVLDAILLSCIDNKDNSQIQLVAELSEILGLQKEDIQYISSMAKAILELDGALYMGTSDIKPESIPDTIIEGYKNFIKVPMIYGTDNWTIVRAEEQNIDAEKLKQFSEIKTPVVQIFNADIDMTLFPLIFKNKTRIVLQSCNIIGGNNNPLKFSNCSEVYIDDCKFQNFTSRTIEVENINRFIINGSVFDNCLYMYKYNNVIYRIREHIGGVIYSYNPKNINGFEIIASTFNGCGVYCIDEHSTSYEGICNIDVMVNDTNINSCSCFDYNYGEKRSLDSCNLFTTSSLKKNCKIKSSAKFN